MPAGCSTGSASPRISISCTTSTPAELTPKPELHGYRKLLDQFGIDPGHALHGRGHGAQLDAGQALGMTTVWVDNGSERGSHGYEDAMSMFASTDVGEWLEEILGETKNDH